MKKHLVPILAVIAACTGFAQAQIITVPNFSFQTSTGTFTGSYDMVGTTSTTGSADHISGWNVTVAPTLTIGYGFILNSSLTSPGTSAGSQAAFLEAYNSNTFQTLSTSTSLGTIAANTKYTLTVAVGAPATWTGVPTGGTKTAGKTGAEAILSLTGNGTSFASDTIAENLVPEGTLDDYTVTFTTGASGGDIGQALGISLEALKVNYPGNIDPGLEGAIFDNVRLTAVSTVPEPRTWALMLGALGGLVFLTRRNFLKS